MSDSYRMDESADPPSLNYSVAKVLLEQSPKHAWMVHPRLRTLEVLRRQAESWLLVAVFGDDEVIRAEPFEAIEFALHEMARQRRPKCSHPNRQPGPCVRAGDVGGHIGDFGKKTATFIAGLREAAEAGENVEFH